MTYDPMNAQDNTEPSRRAKWPNWPNWHITQFNLRVDGCVFCSRIDNHEYDQMSTSAVSFVPLNPVAEGHRLFVPTSHIHPKNNPFSGLTAVGSLLQMHIRFYQTNVGGDFSLILNAGQHASQTVNHFHMHFIPRVENDGLKMPWTEQEERRRLAEKTEPVECFNCGDVLLTTVTKSGISYVHTETFKAECPYNGYSGVATAN